LQVGDKENRDRETDHQSAGDDTLDLAPTIPIGNHVAYEHRLTLNTSEPIAGVALRSGDFAHTFASHFA
jgi:hypothetical protein